VRQLNLGITREGCKKEMQAERGKRKDVESKRMN